MKIFFANFEWLIKIAHAYDDIEAKLEDNFLGLDAAGSIQIQREMKRPKHIRIFVIKEEAAVLQRKIWKILRAEVVSTL